jgi:UDP-glucose 4-epimerase
VFSSTGALYDPANTGVLHEDSPLKATDIYSLSKTTCEQLLRFHSAKTGAQVQVARLFNTVGRRETNAHLIPAIVEQLSSGSRQVHLGNLTPRRDYIHVEDVAQALFTLGEFPVQHTYDCFNVGSGKEFSVLEVARLFEQALSEPLEITSDPERQRKVDRPSQQADISRLRAASAWQPQRSLPQAIQEIWQEHLQASQSQDSGVTR